jgi:hypothetical protein
MSETQDCGSFSAEQARVLADVLDDIIPPSPDGRLPGAGACGIVGVIDAALQPTPALREMVVEGLSALDDLARRRGAVGFAALPRPDKLAVMSELASSEHAFPPVLILHTFAAYYQSARIVAALGLEPRPPHPKGYAMEPDDPTLLDVVRRRPKMYRTC